MVKLQRGELRVVGGKADQQPFYLRMREHAFERMHDHRATGEGEILLRGVAAEAAAGTGGGHDGPNRRRRRQCGLTDGGADTVRGLPRRNPFDERDLVREEIARGFQ